MLIQRAFVRIFLLVFYVSRSSCTMQDAVKYSPERLVKLGQTAALPDSPFSLSDRIGLVWDAFALAKAGYAPVSSALGLISMLRDEKECKASEAI